MSSGSPGNLPEPNSLVILPYDHDDALLAAARDSGQAQLSVYPFDHVAVVLGRGGRPEVELNHANVLADAVPVHKRPGGGCAVVLDPGNVIVSVVLPLPGIGEIKSSFRRITEWLVAGLAEVGLQDVEAKGVSDLARGDEKIGGSCIYRARGLLYFSTTLLVDPDLDLVERYLSHPPREPDYRQGRSHREFMGRLVQRLDSMEAASFAEHLRTILRVNDV